MIKTILKSSLCCLAALTISCAFEEPTVESQSNDNINNNSAASVQSINARKSVNEGAVFASDVDDLAHIRREHREVLQEWLKTKTFLRLAVEKKDSTVYADEYKKNFDSNLNMLREAVGEGNNQYYSIGDMNRDGKQDFAVLLIDNRKKNDETDRFALAIFNAPFSKNQNPSYYEENLYGISNCYIAFDKISEKHLFLGKFESDVYCATYYPKGKSYYFKDCQEE